LQSLKPYIDLSKSYPNADGNVLNAKPLFYMAPKLQLFYIQPQIYTMYGGQFDAYNGNPAVTSSIEVSILDPLNPLPASPADSGYMPPVSHTFATNQLGHVNPDVLGNMAVQGAPCTNAGHTGIAPMGIQSNVTVAQLQPRKLYEALFNAAYNDGTTASQTEIHSYNFQTSRYPDFTAQVNSYQLVDSDGTFLKNAVFDDIAVTLDATQTAQLSALLNGAYPSGDPLEQEYADLFDRLLDGILRIGPLDPPMGTEFNIVRDAQTNGVIGILVRNPEPFNDPKVLAPDINTTIVLRRLPPHPEVFITFYSKDRSRAFAGSAQMNMDLHGLEFIFKYLEYNGASYVPASIVTVNFSALVTP